MSHKSYRHTIHQTSRLIDRERDGQILIPLADNTGQVRKAYFIIEQMTFKSSTGFQTSRSFMPTPEDQ